MSTHGKKYVSQCWLQVPHVDFWKNSSTTWVKRFRFTSCFPMRSVEQLLSQVLRMTKKLTRRRSVDWDHPVYMDLKSFLVKQKTKQYTNKTMQSWTLKLKMGRHLCVSAIGWNTWSSDSLELSESHTSSQQLLWVHPPTWEGLFEKPHVTSCRTGVITLPTHVCWEQIPQKYFRFAFFHYG